MMHYSNYLQMWGSPWAAPTFMGLFVLVAFWSIVWKGMALWKAARQTDKGWFVALLIINTVGILDILYIYIFSKKKS